MIALLCLGHAAEPDVAGAGLCLKDFDFEAAHDERAPAGSGRATFTPDLAEAKQFADLVEVWAFIRRQPSVAPFRWWSDGGPNRPMTGYSWEIVQVPDAAS